MKIEEVPLDRLRPASYNPQRMTDAEYAALKESISEYGYLQVLVANRRSGREWKGRQRGPVIVGGHQRLRALRELGRATVPTIYVDLPPGRERALNLALNNAGSYDPLALGHVLRDFEPGSELLSVAGLTDREIDLALGAVEREALAASGGLVDPEPIALPAHPVTKAGERIRLGRHTLYCGDGTDRKALAALFDGQRATLVVTDPPYGVAYTGKVGSKTWAAMEGDHQRGVALEGFLSGAFRALAAHTTEDASWYVWHSSLNRQAFEGALRAAGITTHQEIVWVKQGITMGRCDYHYQHEPCLYGWGDRHRWIGDRKQSTVWTIEREPAYKHPTQKPVELYRRAIQNSSKQGELIVDPFAGSGPAILAAEQTGRTCIAVEIDPGYCDVIRDRFERIGPAAAKAV